MRWFRISDLPCHRRDNTPQVTLGLNPKAFFMVIPFIKYDARYQCSFFGKKYFSLIQ